MEKLVYDFLRSNKKERIRKIIPTIRPAGIANARIAVETRASATLWARLAVAARLNGKASHSTPKIRLNQPKTLFADGLRQKITENVTTLIMKEIPKRI